KADVAADLPPSLVERAAGLPGARVASVQSQTRVFLAFGNGAAPTDKPLVRKAISHAIDPDSIIKNLFQDRAYPFHGLFVPGELGYDEAFSGNRYDPALAKKLLAEAGFADGLTIPLKYTIGATVLDQQVAEAVAGQLKAVGVTATMDGGPFQVVAKKWRQPGSAGIHLLSFNPVYNDAGFLFQAYFTTGSAWQALAADAKLDKLAADGAGTTEAAERTAAYAKAQRLAITEQAYWSPMYTLQDNYAVSKKITWRPRPDAMFGFEHAGLGG
ncbi:ABC transporter substrate-binding protein, partial [Streptomyces anulatus]|uniref:ABC transporter substrate-binding protein n=1 Tax=Streptomyces anulatus TaxID=1892 RepID=UPI00343A6A7F